MHPNLKYYLAINLFSGINPHTFLEALTYVDSIANLFQLPVNELTALGFNAKQAAMFIKPDWAIVDKEIKWHNSKDQHILCYEDPSYPSLLKEITDPPFVLYVKGNLEALSRPQLAMVGARRATESGVATAEQFAYALSLCGLAVTSGMALGIDAAAHRGALQAGGLTIGVAGTGLYHAYPRSNVTLMQQIIDGNGAIISEFPLDTKPHAYHFPRRNRIVSGLTLGVLVVEAALQSGSLITARLSAEAGREVFAIPGSIAKKLSKGCHYLIQNGAKLVQTVEDIVDELSALNEMVVANNKDLAQQNGSFLTKEEQEVLNLIDDVVTPMDMILCRTKLTACKVSSILLSLELEGYIASVCGGYQRTMT